MNAMLSLKGVSTSFGRHHQNDIHILQVKKNFEAAGGKVLEMTAAQGAEIYKNGCALVLPSDEDEEPKLLTGRLLIDCMGNASPIVRQVSLSMA